MVATLLRESKFLRDCQRHQQALSCISNLFFPSDASAGNWTQTISGSFSLKMPGIPDIRSQGEEERLIAIRADGFVMRFTKRDGGETQTNFVLFPFGQTTETNILGWKIIGNFK